MNWLAEMLVVHRTGDGVSELAVYIRFRGTILGSDYADNSANEPTLFSNVLI